MVRTVSFDVTVPTMIPVPTFLETVLMDVLPTGLEQCVIPVEMGGLVTTVTKVRYNIWESWLGDSSIII